MNTLAVFLLLGLAATVSGQNTTVTTSGIIGFGVSIKANTHTTISYAILGVGPSLEIVVSQDTTLTLALYLKASLTASLPTGYNSLSFNAAVGYTLSLTNGSVIVSANLTTGGLDVIAQQAINASARAAVLQIDVAAQTFQEIAINSYSVAQGLSIPIPQAGTYVLVAVNANVPIPNFYGTLRKLIANAQAAIAYSTNFIVQVTASANADLNVTFSATNPINKAAPSTWVALNVYWDINVSGGASVAAVLNYTFTNTQLTAAGVAANTLKFAYYNTVTGAWEFVAGASVDVNASVVSQTTTHFSTWGLYSDTGATQGTSAGTTTGDAQGVIVSFFLLLSCLLAFL